jgi:photosystem II stability/assembly factor-like uncharacterized protein
MAIPSDTRILLSPGGDSIFRLARPADEVVVGTVDGIFVLARSDGGWSVVDRALEGCFVSAIAALADGGLIAGLHGQGLTRSDDGGRAWRWVNAGLTQFDIWSVRAGIVDGKDVVFAGTMPAALFRSDDGGNSWRDLPALAAVPSRAKWTFPPPPHLGHIKDVVVADGRLLVAVEVGAVLSSRDGGATFEELPVATDPSGCDPHRILVHPDRPGRIVLASGLGVMMSQDDGRSWQRGPTPEGLDYPDPMVLSPLDPDLMFVGGGTGWPPHWYQRGRAMGRIARSRDGGKTWQRLLGGLPDGQRPVFGAMTLADADAGTVVLAGDSDGQVYESRDGGDRWTMIAELAPLSKGDFHIALAKGRKRIAHVDDIRFSGQQKEFMEAMRPAG